MLTGTGVLPCFNPVLLLHLRWIKLAGHDLQRRPPVSQLTVHIRASFVHGAQGAEHKDQRKQQSWEGWKNVPLTVSKSYRDLRESTMEEIWITQNSSQSRLSNQGEREKLPSSHFEGSTEPSDVSSSTHNHVVVVVVVSSWNNNIWLWHRTGLYRLCFQSFRYKPNHIFQIWLLLFDIPKKNLFTNVVTGPGRILMFDKELVYWKSVGNSNYFSPVWTSVAN